MPSSTVEDYLKQIYLAQEQVEQGLVSMGRLAALMGVVPGTVTSMVKSLAESGLVGYEPRGGVRLTRGGEALALRIVRRHRLVELFLVQELGLDWSQVHEEAERLEHVISDHVLARIDARLGHPQLDPHGDPIPPANGRPAGSPHTALSEHPQGTSVKVGRVLDQEPAFLQFLQRHGLRPESIVTIEARDELADALRVRPKGGAAVTLGSAAADKILVEPV